MGDVARRNLDGYVAAILVVGACGCARARIAQQRLRNSPKCRRRGDFDSAGVMPAGVHCGSDSPKTGGCNEPKIRCGHNTEVGVATFKRRTEKLWTLCDAFRLVHTTLYGEGTSSW